MCRKKENGKNRKLAFHGFGIKNHDWRVKTFKNRKGCNTRIKDGEGGGLRFCVVLQLLVDDVAVDVAADFNVVDVGPIKDRQPFGNDLFDKADVFLDAGTAHDAVVTVLDLPDQRHQRQDALLLRHEDAADDAGDLRQNFGHSLTLDLFRIHRHLLLGFGGFASSNLLCNKCQLTVPTKSTV